MLTRRKNEIENEFLCQSEEKSVSIMILHENSQNTKISSCTGLRIRNWRMLLHMRGADAANALTRWQYFSA